MAKEELEIEISADGKVTIKTIGIKGSRCIDVTEMLGADHRPRRTARADERILRNRRARSSSISK